MSVRHNGLLIPGRTIEHFLSSYCTNLAVWSHSEEYPVYTPGSATTLKYRGRYFLVCTRHQLNGTADLSDVCLMHPYGERQVRCITSGGARWYDDVSEGEHKQIAVFDFTDPCREHPELQHSFFDFRGQHPDMPASQTVAFISIGYPTEFAQYDFEEGKVGFQKRRILGQFATPESDDALHVIETVVPIEFDPDGMSGGPTFCINRNTFGEFEVHLAGITARAGGKWVRAVKAGVVQGILDTAFS